MLLLFGWVASRLQHNVCQIVGNLACKTVGGAASPPGVKTGPEHASHRVRIDINTP